MYEIQYQIKYIKKKIVTVGANDKLTGKDWKKLKC